MNKSLTKRTLSGLNWNMLNNYVNAVITTIIGIILARLLEPKEFGLVGMVFVFTGLADLFSTLGMGKSIIRLKNLNEDHIRTATSVTILSSIIIFIIFYFISPLISDFYNETQLISIIRVLAIIFILKGISTVSYSQIMKELDFKTIMMINIGNSITYGVISSTLAFFGLGVWSLVYGRISSQVLATIISVYKFPVKINFRFKKQEFKELAGYGSGVSMSSILLYASSNIDFLIIGKFLSTNALGLYTRAFNLMTQSISRVVGGIYNVLFPAFAAVQNDKQKLKKAYLRTIKTVTYFIFPILGIMIVDAEYIIKGLYGTKWAGTIPVFKILAFGGILRSTLSYSGAMAQATGSVYKEMFQQLIYLIILSGGIFYGIRFGIEGVAFAVIFAIMWMFVLQTSLALKIIDSGWKEFFLSLIPGLCNLILMVIINLSIILLLDNIYKGLHYEIKLIVVIIVNIPIFLLVILFVPSSVKGDTFEWLVNNYERFIPSFFSNLYYKFNQQNKNKVNIES
ncbi:MAG: lipopolysaccharide biosynthesis protein [Romboutsia sp.]|nr:lipopolysaccharide biosynthesis protein [Romboutsia sp.]